MIWVDVEPILRFCDSGTRMITRNYSSPYKGRSDRRAPTYFGAARYLGFQLRKQNPRHSLG